MKILEKGMILAEKYRIDEVIGTGGFGTTYLGYDLILQVRIAIKEYLQSSDSGRYLAEQEANILSKLYGIPNIVKMMNFFYEDGCPYMVMEYVEGITLREYLDQNKFVNATDAIGMIQPLIAALKQVHKSGIIHRDISPDNMILSPDGKMTLVDFGSALEMAHREDDLPVVLKPGYAAPEQYQQDGNQGTWTDVYALCATLYRIIMGRKPPEAMELITHSARIIWDADRLPGNVARVIAAGLSIKQDARIQTMSELEMRLVQSLAAKPINQRKRLGIGITLILVMAVAIGFILIRQEPEDISKKAAVDTLQEKQEPEEAQEQTQANENTLSDDTEAQSNVKYTSEDKFSTEDCGDGVAITGVAAELTEVNIPPMIGGKPVYQITGMGANVVTVTIPEGVTALGEYSFKNCRYLESIVLPSTVSDIAAGAFQNCNSLKSVVIGEDNLYYYAVGNEILESNHN